MDINIGVYDGLTQEEIERIKKALEAQRDKTTTANYNPADYIDILDVSDFISRNAASIGESMTKERAATLLAEHGLASALLISHSLLENRMANALLASNDTSIPGADYDSGSLDHLIRSMEINRALEKEGAQREMERLREEKIEIDEAGRKKALDDLMDQLDQEKEEAQRAREEQEARDAEQEERDEQAEREREQKEKEEKERLEREEAEQKKEEVKNEEENEPKSGRYIDPETGEPYDPAEREKFRKMFADILNKVEENKTEEEKKADMIKRIIAAAMENRDIDPDRPSCGTVPLGNLRNLGAFENKVSLNLYSVKKK